jgi:hypothetical protein
MCTGEFAAVDMVASFPLSSMWTWRRACHPVSDFIERGGERGGATVLRRTDLAQHASCGHAQPWSGFSGRAA